MISKANKEMAGEAQRGKRSLKLSYFPFIIVIAEATPVRVVARDLVDRSRSNPPTHTSKHKVLFILNDK